MWLVSSGSPNKDRASAHHRTEGVGDPLSTSPAIPESATLNQHHPTAEDSVLWNSSLMPAGGLSLAYPGRTPKGHLTPQFPHPETDSIFPLIHFSVPFSEKQCCLIRGRESFLSKSTRFLSIGKYTYNAYIDKIGFISPGKGS